MDSTALYYPPPPSSSAASQDFSLDILTQKSRSQVNLHYSYECWVLNILTGVDPRVSLGAQVLGPPHSPTPGFEDLI